LLKMARMPGRDGHVRAPFAEQVVRMSEANYGVLELGSSSGLCRDSNAITIPAG
jgi:hypothetical protein